MQAWHADDILIFRERQVEQQRAFVVLALVTGEFGHRIGYPFGRCEADHLVRFV